MASATPAGKPGAPQGVGTSRIGTTITVDWSAAKANGSAIQWYEVDELEGITWLGWTSVGTSTTYEKTGASSSRAYTFRVRAKNGVDYGPTVEVTAPVPGPGGKGDPDGSAKTLATLAGPTELAVFGAPNPFNPSTTLYFHLPEDVPVTLVIYNVAGQPVTELIDDEDLSAGIHARAWGRTARRIRPIPLPAHRGHRFPRRETRPHSMKGRPAASGVYVYRLVTPAGVQTRKLTLLR